MMEKERVGGGWRKRKWRRKSKGVQEKEEGKKKEDKDDLE